MNIQLAFAFGMLTMVAISMLVVIVIGMLKVSKLAKQVQYIQSELDRTTQHTYHRIDAIHISMTDMHSIIDRRIDGEIRNVVDEIDQTRRTIDSRFDKFENRIMTKVEPDMTAIDLVIEKTKGKKQLLKD